MGDSRTGAAVGAHEEHLGADIEAAVEYVVKADATGRVVEFNLAALQHDLAIFSPFSRNCNWAMLEHEQIGVSHDRIS